LEPQGASEVSEPREEAAPQPQEEAKAEAVPVAKGGRLKRASGELVARAQDGADAGAVAAEPASKKKRKAAPSTKNLSPRIDGAKSPQLPRLAFEWFKDSCGEDDLSAVVQLWKALPERGRMPHMASADEDLKRFEAEYETWRSQKVGGVGDLGKTVAALLDERRMLLERKLGRLDRASTRAKKALGEEGQAKARAPPRQKPPKDYPVAVRTAYALFCKEQCDKRRAAEADTAAAAAPGEPKEEEVKKEGHENGFGSEAQPIDVEKEEGKQSKPKRNVLKELRETWNGLSLDERGRYDVLSAQDGQRFQTEHAAWLAKQPEGGLGFEGASAQGAAGAVAAAPKARGAKRPLPKAQVPKTPKEIFVRPRSEMSDLLQHAFVHGLEERKQEQRRQAQQATAEALQGSLADGSAALGPDGAPLPEGFGGGGGSPQGSPRLGAKRGRQGSLLEPLGPAVARAPDTTVDDLLGDLMAVDGRQRSDSFDEDGSQANEFGDEDDDGFAGGGAGALMPHANFAPGGGFGLGMVGSDMPSAAGAPKALGPQLCIDESGNLVLDKSSLSVGPELGGSIFDAGAVTSEESVREYEQAYRRTAPARWTQEETDTFYEALRLYGADLFLVQTMFRNKSAGAIKQKYTKEVRKFPDKVKRALTVEAKKLTKDVFEKLHGKIDTSKHFKPPPSPVDGEEPEPDGSIPGGPGGLFGAPEGEGGVEGEEEAAPPPEPEYSAEDESLTTNRLMALFD